MKSDPYRSSECLQGLHNDCGVTACKCRCHQTGGLQPMFGEPKEEGDENADIL